MKKATALILFFAFVVFTKAYNQSWIRYTDSAKIFEAKKEYDRAAYYYSKASHELRTDSAGTLTYAKNCFALADAYFEMNDYENAEPLYLEAKQIFDKIPGRKDTVFVKHCDNLARIYSDVLNFEEAEKLFLENKQIITESLGKENAYYAKSISNLAALYLSMRDFEKAELFCTEAKILTEKFVGKSHPLYATSCMNLGSLYYLTGRLERAEPLYLEARRLWAVIKHQENYARVCNNLAILYSDLNAFAKAQPFGLEAKRIWEKIVGKDHVDYANSCLNLGIIYWNLKKIEQAHAAYLEAFKSQYNYYVKKTFGFTSEEEKYFSLRDIYGYSGDFFSFNTLAYSHWRQGGAYDVSVSIRNLVLSSALQMRRAIHGSANADLTSQYDQWIRIKEQLSLLYSAYTAINEKEIKALEAEANSLEKKLVRHTAGFKMQHKQRNIGWRNIQQSLKPNEAAVEFVDFVFFNGTHWTDSIYYIALLLRKDKPEPILIPLFEEKQVQKLFARYPSVNALYRGVEVGKGAINDSSVYNLVWKPLEKHLHGIGKIYFAPTGVLHKISLAALPTLQGRVLIDKYELVQLNSTASVVNSTNTAVAQSDDICLYGGIQYDADSIRLKKAVKEYYDNKAFFRSHHSGRGRRGRWNFLEGTKTEIEGIVRLAKEGNFPIRALSGIDATEESFRALNGKSSPAVLHIATHGFFYAGSLDSTEAEIETNSKSFEQSENPLIRSGLLFAGANNAWSGHPVAGIDDGILTAYEVANLYLPNTKLVVLSACETGLGEVQSEEGVFGLQRAFKMAGVQNLVMSLWKVPDPETAEFMQEFYKNMFKKQPINDSFYQAQTTMRKKYHNDPYKWAAWVLVR